MKILYIQRGPTPPPSDERLDGFFALSARMQGDVLLPVWWTEEEAAKAVAPGSRFLKAGIFRYHLYPIGRRRPGILRRLAMLRFYLRTGWQIHRTEPFDCVVSYGYTLTALAGVILKWTTGARLIIELPGEPGKAYLFSGFRPIVGRILSLFSIGALHLTLLCADRASLLYPGQLQRFPLLRRVPASVNHAFVPISVVPQAAAAENYVLSVGYPWYLKGADVLIRSFRAIAAEFPDCKLKLLGHYGPDDRAELLRLIGDCTQIELHKPLPYSETLQTIAKALIVALPTRTEGMGRVLVEAMAARRPCVASAVGGVPHYIRDGYNGLLVRTGDVADLAARLRLLLKDSALREQLASNAFEDAHSRLSEPKYAERFEDMVSLTTRK